MPRPKVLPENRLRVQEACRACRMTKKRCSGTFPCVKCIRTNRAATCVPVRSSSTSVRRQYTSIGTRSPIPGPQNTPHSSVSNQSPSNRASVPSSTEPGSRSPEALHRTRPRMLRNLQGERVYIGRSASLSFLQLVRDTVTQYIGPSQFSHNVKSEDMLETETPHDIAPVIETSLDPYQIQSFLRAYQIAANGFIYFPSDPEKTPDEQASTPGYSSSARSAMRDIKIAIGAQSVQNDPTTTHVERFFFARGQRIAFAGMVETPSLEMVKLFVLMSFYMFGACRRNAAYMYLGIAARAAVALGLHLRDSFRSVSIPEQRERTRAWMSLCTLDLLTSSILGRPPATGNLRSEFGEKLVDMDEPSPVEERLIASYRMSQILDKIIVRLYGENAASTETAESLLEQLNKWSDSLPSSVLIPPDAETERLAAQEHIVGSLHVACSYHFAVIIVTRPFLISSLGVRLARLCKSPGDHHDEILQEDPAHAKLALACTDSALYMMQTCMEVYHSELLLGNMCILKAFVFAAALVLGFSMFSQKEPESAVEHAFNGALEILRILAHQSVQASHYYEIISSLKNAITEQRQRLLQFRLPNKNRYVNKLFSLNGHRSLPNSQDNMSMSVEHVDSIMATSANILDSWNFIDAGDNDDTFAGWDGMELPLWDSFPFIHNSLSTSNRTSESNQVL